MKTIAHTSWIIIVAAEAETVAAAADNDNDDDDDDKEEKEDVGNYIILRYTEACVHQSLKTPSASQELLGQRWHTTASTCLSLECNQLWWGCEGR